MLLVKVADNRIALDRSQSIYQATFACPAICSSDLFLLPNLLLLATKPPQSLANRLLDQCAASRWDQSARQASDALWGHCGEGVLSSSLPPAKLEGSATDAACLTGLYHLYLACHFAPVATDANHRC